MKVFDAGFISLLLAPSAPAPIDPKTSKPVERIQQRVEELVSQLDEQGEKVLLPTPALSEFLVLAADDGPQYLTEINRSSVFKVVDFDQRAAVEAAILTRSAKDKGDKKGGSTSPWDKIKFDRQIVAIAKVNGADAIYSTDKDVVRYGKDAGVRVFGVVDLPEPPPEQLPLTYEARDQETPEPESADIPGSGNGPPEGQAAPEGKADDDEG